ncbi:MAG: lipooligosaccharide sialyltransferase [Lachnospiraceae bacterium]|nr:lipooligosaccharide sialyltransferase [Lachnospiraceae bacterium]
MKKRIYICHTFYHVYIACLKELNKDSSKWGEASLMLSKLSNDFGNLKSRAEQTGLFEEVIEFDEKEESFFPELVPLKKDTGNLVKNMIQRIRFTKKFGKLLAPYVPVDLKQYEDIYVFCDSDPIGYYLSTHRIYYHALEDGLDCIRYYDTARYDNRGHFGLKAWMAAHNLIFIQNGYSKYCLDMEVNDISVLQYPCPKYIEKPRKELTENLSLQAKEMLVSIFVENKEELEGMLKQAGGDAKILVLTEPLCDLETRKQIFRDIIEEFGSVDGKPANILLKPHPRDVLDYRELFPEHIVLDGKFPMEILNYVEGLVFDKVISVFTVPHAIMFAKEKVFLGEDFMDKYEAPEIHRQNEQI